MNQLAAFQSLMHEKKISHYLIPSADPHFSEYLPPHWKTREWLSGFSGSAGTLLLSTDQAYLWVDSRYYIQAEQECAKTGIKIMKLGQKGVPSVLGWLRTHKAEISTLGLNKALFSATMFEKIESLLPKKVIQNPTIVDAIWKNRPKRASADIHIYEPKFAGQSVQKNIENLREYIKNKNITHFLFSALDQIAWFLNLRGSDIPCNPVFYSFLIVDLNDVNLFIFNDNVTFKITDFLSKNGVKVRNYEDFGAFITTLSHNTVGYTKPINQSIYQKIASKNELQSDNWPILQKASRNEVQQKMIEKAMIKDGVALANAFYSLEKTLEQGKTINEHTFGQQLAYFRGLQENYKGESFSPIVGFNENGAVVHYSAKEESAKEIHSDGYLLVDSGGQYLEGTTDITRTFFTGTSPDDTFCKHYTLVLKGHLALARAHFPVGTKGVQLDVLARQFLWEHGLNYGHGTGHGVGHFLNVHEGPQGISPATRGNATNPIPAYSVTSNEPGYYLNGKYGIRIENCEMAIPAAEGFMKFKTLTYFPYELGLIQTSLLSPLEKNQINRYHNRTSQALTPHLEGEIKEWFLHKCRQIE